MAKAVIFMGTPHCGVETVSWATFAARALKALQMGTVANTDLLSDPENNSEGLRQVSKQFAKRCGATETVWLIGVAGVVCLCGRGAL